MGDSKSILEILRNKFPQQCKSLSENSCVLEVYKVVLENEDSDSDYWNEDHGAGDIIRVFEDYFIEFDWIELEEDLGNWTTFQLELFTQAILGGYCSYFNNLGVYSDNCNIENLTKTICNRFNLILPLIRIEKTRELKGDIVLAIIENTCFLNDHFDIIVKHDEGNLAKLIKIIEELIIHSFKDKNIIALLNKIEKANSK